MNYLSISHFVSTVYAQTTSGCLPNPLGVSSVNDLLYLAVDIATYVGVVLAVIFLIYAGFKYIAARGNSDKITEAHHFLLAVVIGIAILIGATAIVNVVKNTLTSAGLVKSTTFNSPTSSNGTGCGTSATSANSSAQSPITQTAQPQTTQTTQNTTVPSSGFQGGGGGTFGGGGAGGSY